MSGAPARPDDGTGASVAAAAYATRLAQRRTAAERYAHLDGRMSLLRMVVFLAGIGVAWCAFDRHIVSPGWVLAPAAVFAGLLLAHERVVRRRRHFERAVQFYEQGIARIEDRWASEVDSGAEFLDAAHPYAADLDLFGRGSLFQLLSTARTGSGEAALAHWLCSPAAPAEVRARQAAVRELAPQLDLREELALVGAEIRAAADARGLAQWATADAVLAPRGARLLAAALAALAVVSVIPWAFGWTVLPLAVALALEAAVAWRLRQRVARIIRAAQRPSRDLRVITQMLAVIERQRFACDRLRALRAALDTDGVPPSRRIAALHRLLHLLDARKNQLFAPLSAALLWGTQLSLAIEAWRLRNGSAIGRWLRALGEIEAFCALAGYAYERPDTSFPEIADDGSPHFDAAGLGHPLIPASRCVRNDVHLGGATRLLIISGSNMSGKSTLLRAIGTNAVLAFAGAPVCAQRLRLSPLAIGCSIRIEDSLQHGTSRFYAEITRLRQLMELATAGSLLFLLDEILHGTNSHDRGIGAEAVVRGLLARNAIGLITTHDLALAHIEQRVAAAANVHFEDQLRDGRMIFDYRMRPGVVTRSNAVALMRAVGLEVE